MKSIVLAVEKYNEGKGTLGQVFDLAKEYEKEVKNLKTEVHNAYKRINNN